MRWFSLLLVVVSSSVSHAEDWPQFLGPRRDGTSKETIAPWKGDVKVAWKATVGDGHSSPIVADGLVILHDRPAGQEVERVTAFDAVTGKVVATTQYARPKFENQFGNGPRATPVISGNRLYTLGVTGRLGFFTVDKVNAKIADDRHVDLLEQFKLKNLTFGVSATPLVEGNLVITQSGGDLQAGPKEKGAGILAYQRDTGTLAWQATTDAASYATPMAIGGKDRQIVVLTQKGLVGLAPNDGAVLWQYPFKDLLNESSTTPILVNDILIASSVTRGSVALKLTEKDGKITPVEVWKQAGLNCYFSTPVAVAGKYHFMVNGVLAANPTIALRCVDASNGNTLWVKPRIGKFHAAIVKMADDRLLMLDDAGYLSLFDSDPKAYKELARSKVCGNTWAHPAVANGRVYLRDATELICLEFGK